MPLLFAETDAAFLAYAGLLADEHDAGGQVTFWGRVRARNRHKDVSHLVYEAHTSLCERLFLALEEQARKRFALLQSHACHRLGEVEVGQASVVIHARAAHRHEAFLAARFLIDELKKTLPIWRKEIYRDHSFSFEQSHCHDGVIDQHLRKEIFAPSERALLAMGIDSARLAHKHVVLIGAGGLGCPLAINLAALNVRLTVVDGDRVSSANLARQYAYRVQEQGQLKGELLHKFLLERFGSLTIAIDTDFANAERVLALAQTADLVIDATDDPGCKIMLKRLAYKHRFALISASVHQQDGEVSVYVPGHDSCLLCFASKNDGQSESCARVGVLTHVCQMVAAHATASAVRVLCGQHHGGSTMTIVDPVRGLHVLRIARDPGCANCGAKMRARPLARITRAAS